MADGARKSGLEQAASAVAGIAERRGRVAAIPAIDVHVYPDLGALPEAVSAFLAKFAARSFFLSAEWFRIVSQTAGAAAEQPRLYAAQAGGRVLAVLIVRERRAAGPLKTRLVASPSRGLDAFIYGPLLDAGEEGEAGIRAILGAMLRAAPPVHIFRFECLDTRSTEYRLLLDALHARRMLIRTFADPFSTYWENVEGLTLDAYLERRTPEMREFIARQTGALASRARFELVTGGANLAPALIDYALIDLQSWKSQEPYPNCLAQLLDTVARRGMLRLGLLYVDDKPAAAQIWIVGAGRATMWRSRFARQFALLSVGTALTFEMIRHVLLTDKARILEFGPGDDPGRQEWLGERCERIGFTAFNTRSAKGLAVVARHFGGSLARAGVQRLRRLLRRR
jgi:CelD/BcsL family acetyltransferase involved in cellulose biosynthesis